VIERKTLQIQQVKEIELIPPKNLPKLAFMANDGQKDMWYHTFKQKAFKLIKPGLSIDCDVEQIIQKGVTNYRIVQVYENNQPIIGKGTGTKRYGKSPEELDQSARTMALSYAKDLAVASKIELSEITTYADNFYHWVKKVQ